MDLRERSARKDAAFNTAPARPVLAIAARIGLWLLVAAGAFGGAIGVLRPASTGAAPSQPAEQAPPAVAGFAELVAERWIGRADDPSTRLAMTAAEPRSTTEGFVATGSGSAVEIREVARRRWAVTVAIDVVERRNGQTLPEVTWFVEVAVVADGTGALGVGGAPGLVPGPSELDLSIDAPPWRTPSRDDPFATTILGFASALLAGGGDVSRYLAPGLDVQAVDPPLFAAVTVERLAVEPVTPGVARVRVLLDAQTAAGNSASLSYALELRERDGRWEIADLSTMPTGTRTGVAPPPERPATTTPTPGA